MIETKNAKIQSTHLGMEGHGLPSAMINLDYGGAGQGFGGYHLGGAACHQFVFRVLEVVGVERWEDLPGTPVRVRADFDKIHAIGHFIEDRWYEPATEMRALKSEASR